MSDVRARLAAAQEALVRALCEGGAPPGGFDPARLAAAADSLACKKARVAERAGARRSRWSALSDWFRRATSRS